VCSGGQRRPPRASQVRTRNREAALHHNHLVVGGHEMHLRARHVHMSVVHLVGRERAPRATHDGLDLHGFESNQRTRQPPRHTPRHATSESGSKSTGLAQLCQHAVQPTRRPEPWDGDGAYGFQDALVAARLELLNQRTIAKDTDLLARGDLQLLFDVVRRGKRRAADRVLRRAPAARWRSADTEPWRAGRGRGTMEASKPWLARRFTMSARETLASSETQKTRFPWRCRWRSVSIDCAASASGPTTSARHWLRRVKQLHRGWMMTYDQIQR
jgi:hypothetical protein